MKDKDYIANSEKWAFIEWIMDKKGFTFDVQNEKTNYPKQNEHIRMWKQSTVMYAIKYD